VKARVSAKLRWLFVGGSFVVLLDQLAKRGKLASLGADPGVPIFTFWDERLSFIPTQSFTLVSGLLAGWPRPGQIVLVGFIAAGVAVLASAFYRGLAPGESMNAFALGLVVGGVVGNLADVFLHGGAVEVLGAAGVDPGLRFNFADGFIALGLVILVVELLVAEGALRARLARRWDD
jgi:lipoprotein signal peptidase